MQEENKKGVFMVTSTEVEILGGTIVSKNCVTGTLFCMFPFFGPYLGWLQKPKSNPTCTYENNQQF